MFYRGFFHYFELFLREYESRFEKEYGYFRSVIQDVVDKIILNFDIIVLSLIILSQHDIGWNTPNLMNINNLDAILGTSNCQTWVKITATYEILKDADPGHTEINDARKRLAGQSHEGGG